MPQSKTSAKKSKTSRKTKPARRPSLLQRIKGTKFALPIVVVLLAAAGFAGYSVYHNFVASAASDKRIICHHPDSWRATQKKIWTQSSAHPESYFVKPGKKNCNDKLIDYGNVVYVRYAGFRQSYDGRPFGACHKGNRFVRPSRDPIKITYKGYKYRITEPGKKPVCTNRR